jgi:rare lipoprotein A
MKLGAAAAAFASVILVFSCQRERVIEKPEARRGGGDTYQRGKAAWYGGRFHGRKTASGERFNKNKLTAAHRRLPFGTVVRVTNEKNGRSVEVRITDRGPYGGGRVIDLSEAAARTIGIIDAGVARVRIEIVAEP